MERNHSPGAERVCGRGNPPRYRDADPAHGIGHIRQVMENSRELAGSLEVEAKMVYLIAAYHDLGVCRFGRRITRRPPPSCSGGPEPGPVVYS